jgi:hypothetical protein
MTRQRPPAPGSRRPPSKIGLGKILEALGCLVRDSLVIEFVTWNDP